MQQYTISREKEAALFVQKPGVIEKFGLVDLTMFLAKFARQR